MGLQHALAMLGGHWKAFNIKLRKVNSQFMQWLVATVLVASLAAASVRMYSTTEADASISYRSVFFGRYHHPTVVDLRRRLLCVAAGSGVCMQTP